MHLIFLFGLLYIFTKGKGDDFFSKEWRLASNGDKVLYDALYSFESNEMFGVGYSWNIGPNSVYSALFTTHNGDGHLSKAYGIGLGFKDEFRGLNKFKDNLILTGFIAAPGNSYDDCMVLRVNATTHDILWGKRISGPNDWREICYGSPLLTSTSNPQIIISGYTLSFVGGSSSFDRSAMLFSMALEDGTILWNKIWDANPGNSWDELTKVIELIDGNLVAVGSGQLFAGDTSRDAIIAKVNSSQGDVLWSKNYGLNGILTSFHDLLQLPIINSGDMGDRHNPSFPRNPFFFLK